MNQIAPAQLHALAVIFDFASITSPDGSLARQGREWADEARHGTHNFCGMLHTQIKCANINSDFQTEFPMDEEFCRERLRTVKELAEKADPFIKRRLLELAGHYERRINENTRPPEPARQSRSPRE